MDKIFGVFTIIIVAGLYTIQAAPADTDANNSSSSNPIPAVTPSTLKPAETSSTLKPAETSQGQVPAEFPRSGDLEVGDDVTTVRIKPTTEKIICHGRTPCGWAIYTPFVREIEQFITNRCVCPSHLYCSRSNDNYSIAAYVYRCSEHYNPDEAPENYIIH